MRRKVKNVEFTRKDTHTIITATTLANYCNNRIFLANPKTNGKGALQAFCDQINLSILQCIVPKKRNGMSDDDVIESKRK
jgi:hypothetical protein